MTWRVWLILFAMVAWSADAHAKFYYGKFGAHEQIEYVGSVTLPGPAGEKLYLARKVTMRWLFVPYSVRDDGFVLAVFGDAHKHYPMPAGARLQELQARGYLPNPLPAWRLSTFDRVTGNALWIFILVLAGSFGFKRLLRTRSGRHQASSSSGKFAPIPEPHPAVAAMKRSIAQRRKDDPLIGAKLGGKEVVAQLLRVMKDSKGVHAPTLLGALGALAGYACQASVRAEQVQMNGTPEPKVFVLVQGKDGRQYFFGDLLNKPLAEDRYSVYSIAAGAAQALGAKQLIDLKEIFTHVAHTVGGEIFGVPRVAEAERGAYAPIDVVKNLWPKLLPLLKDFCDKPFEWPILYGCAIQEAMQMSKDLIEPGRALTVVMESAVPMSKVDLSSY